MKLNLYGAVKLIFIRPS